MAQARVCPAFRCYISRVGSPFSSSSTYCTCRVTLSKRKYACFLLACQAGWLAWLAIGCLRQKNS